MLFPRGFSAIAMRFRGGLLLCAFVLTGAGTSRGLPIAHPLGQNAGASVRVSPLSRPVGVTGLAETVLYRFKGPPDGSFSEGGLIGDSFGALYGVTVGGGIYNDGFRGGTFFRLMPSGGKYVETYLHSFNYTTDGEAPNGPLIRDTSGALYGTAQSGGTGNCPGGSSIGCGTVFKFTPSGSGYTERILYNFAGGMDGAFPTGSLVADKTGALFGVTGSGGVTSCNPGPTPGCGTVFKLTPSGSGYAESIVYRFQGRPHDGYSPSGPLIVDSAGALYGSTFFGGSGDCQTNGGIVGCGTIFKLMPSGPGYAESLFSFPTASAGGGPTWGVIADRTGALFGTTNYGGDLNACPAPQSLAGCGTVFKLTPSQSGYTERMLYRFRSGNNDGIGPAGGVIMDKTGALYGTTEVGGPFGYGAVFVWLPSLASYGEKIIYFFTGAPDGGAPFGSLITDKTGALYGTTASGGLGFGTVFKLSP